MFLGSFERENYKGWEEPVEEPEMERLDSAFVLIVQDNHQWKMKYSNKEKGLTMVNENELVTDDQKYRLTFYENGFELTEIRVVDKRLKRYKYKYKRKGTSFSG